MNIYLTAEENELPPKEKKHLVESLQWHITDQEKSVVKFITEVRRELAHAMAVAVDELEPLIEEHGMRPHRTLAEADLDVIKDVQHIVGGAARAASKSLESLRKNPPSELWRTFRGGHMRKSGAGNLGQFAYVVEQVEEATGCAGDAIKTLASKTSKANRSGDPLVYLFGTVGLSWERIGYEPEGLVSYAIETRGTCELTESLSVYGAWWSLHRMLAMSVSTMFTDVHAVEVVVRKLTGSEWNQWKGTPSQHDKVKEKVRTELRSLALKTGQAYEVHSPNKEVLDFVSGAAIQALPPSKAKAGRAATMAAQSGKLPKPWQRGAGYKGTRGQPELEPSEPYVGKRIIAGREYAEPGLGSRHPLAPSHREPGRPITKDELKRLKKEFEESKTRSKATPNAASDLAMVQWLWDVMP